MSSPRLLLQPRPFLWIVALLCSCLALPGPLRAQCCDDGTGPGIDGPPLVHVYPSAVTVAQPAVPVTVVMRDSLDVVQSTFKVLLTAPDGTVTDVTSQFSFSKSWDESRALYNMIATATGSVALSPKGPVRLTASACDVPDAAWAERCTTSEPAVFRMAVPGVEVTPDGSVFATGVASEPRTHAFAVANGGSEHATFMLSVDCRDENGEAISGCSVPLRVHVAAGASASVNATYPASQRRVISMVVTARHATEGGVQDAGWVDITLHTGTTTATRAPLVAAVPMNAGTTIERAQCVTVATALRGAYECGDLRVVHALPAHRTYNRAWAPVLMYNSQHAHPTPTVYADVTVADSTQQPTSVQVIVRLRDGTVRQATYAGDQFLPGAARRVGVSWNGIGMRTGVHGYTLQVINHYGSMALPSEPIPGELAVVNRENSPFGAGWWLAGWEQFVCIDCSSATQRRLWVGGDGSTRVYTASNNGQTWRATHPDGPPDSIVAMANGGFVRHLRGGGRIEFNGFGEHVRTVNRLGQATGFDVQGNRLFGIAVAVPSGTAPGWAFGYENFSPGAWRLKTITATAPGAAARTVKLLHGGNDWRVTGITDPDGLGVIFGYVTGAHFRRIDRHRDRRGTWTFYGYNTGGKLTASRTQMGTSVDATKDLTTGFVAAESRGVARDSSTTGTSVPASAVYTRLDGPRPQAEVIDHTYLWLNADGTIRRIRNAVGAETRVRYGDPRFPALATEVSGPSGMYTRAWYDGEGRPIARTVFGQYSPTESSTTHTAWDPVCHKPTMVTSAVADTTWMAYDQATCNPLWQRLGRDPDRTVDYAYYGAGTAHAGMVRAVVGPRDAEGRRAREEVEYDARGNLRLTRDPLGFITVRETDALGRDTAVYTPIWDDSSARTEALLKQHGARQTIRYNAAGLPDSTVTYGPALNQPTHGGYGPGLTGADTLTVTTTYDGEGSPRKVTRWVRPNPGGLSAQVTEYEYDAAGRRTDEYTNGTMHQHFVYDQGGNVVEVVTPRLHSIRNRYDAANRLVRREVPEAVAMRTSGSCPPRQSQYEPTCDQAIFPFYPNFGTGYKMPAEWTTYRYDLAGNMVRVENADAIVERTYYPNGQVRTDSTRIRDFSDGYAFAKVFGIEYGYHEGRMTVLRHPSNLANTSGTADTDIFVYDPRTGALSAARDRNGNEFFFRHDAAGRTTSMLMPGGVVDSMRYDLAGRTTWRREWSPAHPDVALQEESFVYDARGKVLAVSVPVTLGRAGSTFRQWYSGSGNLVMTDWVNGSNPQWQRERFTVDPLGNTVHRHEYGAGTEAYGNDHPDYRTTYSPLFGRVEKVERVDPEGYGGSTPPVDESWFRYDESGNQVTTYQRSGPGGGVGYRHLVDTRSFYGADDRLRAFQKYDDVLGSIRSTSSGLWEEYRYDGLGRRVAVRTLRPNELCNDTSACYNSITYFVWAGDQLLWELREAASNIQHAGGIVSYFQAGGIDRPLTIWEEGTGTVITHQSWRGQFARGTFGSGTRAGQSSDCTEYPATNGCIPVRWPGWNTTAWSQEAAKPATTGSEEFWFGSLSVGMRDASGQQYMRNRYYNPQTGQFTQPDPIGLAGGLNSYGFAAGDPVSYSDPYGLSACNPPTPECLRSQRAFSLGSGQYRPGQFAGAASMIVRPIAEPVGEHGAVRVQGTAGNVTVACAGGAAQGCSQSVEVSKPALGVSISAGWLNSSEPTVWANFGRNKHLSVSVSPDRSVWLNAGIAVGGQPISGTVDVPSGNAALARIGASQEPVAVDATSVSNLPPVRQPAPRRACAPSGGCAEP